MDETIAQEKKVKVGFFATASFSFSVSCYKTKYAAKIMMLFIKIKGDFLFCHYKFLCCCYLSCK